MMTMGMMTGDDWNQSVLIYELIEAYSMGKMPDIPHVKYQEEYGKLIPKSTKIADVRKNLELYCFNDRVYMLVKDHNIVLGNATLSPADVAGKQYLHVDGIFVDPLYRKTSATYWLIYAIKELVKYPVIADGAIFSDGKDLITALQKHEVLNVGDLNLVTGEVSALTAPINSSTHCYLFDSAKIGFGKHMFEGTNLPFTWYPLFEEIE